MQARAAASGALLTKVVSHRPGAAVDKGRLTHIINKGRPTQAGVQARAAARGAVPALGSVHGLDCRLPQGIAISKRCLLTYHTVDLADC